MIKPPESPFEGVNSTFFHRGHNAESVKEYNYKIRDDSVRPREFLGTDNEDGIESILEDRNGHSLHEYIDGDDPLFCVEIYPDWDINTLTIASSSDSKKISLHISTFGLRLKNISKVAKFTELVQKKLPIGLQNKNIIDNIANKKSFSLRILGTPKFIEETKEHV
ncbi:4492_t:CDS:2 [Entrophospora sp. SA101]|nr:4492_t:CDS:2 [Entrophospora sp. SA101]